MSIITIKCEGKKAIPYFRNNGDFDYMLVPDLESNTTFKLDLGFDIDKLHECTNYIMSMIVSNNLQV